VVTGAASGVGKAIAGVLVRRGDTVVIADIDAAGARRAADELTARGPGSAIPAELDIRDADAVTALFHKVRDDTGRLDLVFNNAGVAIRGPLEKLTPDHWRAAIDINLRGVINGVQAAYPIMLEQSSGHIVNTASLAGLVAMPMGIPYTTTKHAIVGLSLALRAEAAARGVNVSVICSGYVDTPMLTNANPGLPDPMAGTENRLKQRFAPYPPEKLARTVIRGVDRNRALIVAPLSARLVWRAARLSPAGTTRVVARGVRRPAGSAQP
jgi:NAD(P)-dependent dehydrogenase (short-subunit alcohol dehydrogenase family)